MLGSDQDDPRGGRPRRALAPALGLGLAVVALVLLSHLVASARQPHAGRAAVSLVPGVPRKKGPLPRGVHRFAPPATPPGVPRGALDTLGFFSPALHRRDAALVYLPPGYRRAAAAGHRFPVLYVLHGTPGDATSIFDGGWAGRDANVLLADHRIRRTIIVAPYGRYGRANETEWANGRRGRYLSYIADVVRAVDDRLSTIRARSARVLAGDSEGAFGATNVALHDLSLFGAFQSWSGYFHETPAGTFAGAGPGTIAANSPADYVPLLAPRIRRVGLRAYLYAGAQDRWTTAQLSGFVAELRAAGARVGSAVYPGGHNWTLWRAQMPHMLTLASGWLSSGP